MTVDQRMSNIARATREQEWGLIKGYLTEMQAEIDRLTGKLSQAHSNSPPSASKQGQEPRNY